MQHFDLREWDLTELVKNPKSPQFTKQIQIIENKVKSFEKNKTYLKNTILPKKFFRILKELEEISKEASIVGGYASLVYSANTQSDEATTLLTRITKWGSDIENRTLFFDQWWKKQIDQ